MGPQHEFWGSVRGLCGQVTLCHDCGGLQDQETWLVGNRNWRAEKILSGEAKGGIEKSEGGGQTAPDLLVLADSSCSVANGVSDVYTCCEEHT